VERKKMGVMMMMMLFLLMSISAQAATYYVSNKDGNDSNPGTSSSTPWKTIARVNSMSFSPGDDILFKRGDTWRETESLKPSSAGDSSASITFGAYGSREKPVIDGRNVTYTVTMNKSYVTLDNLNITRGGKNNIGSVAAADYCRIQNCRIDNAVRQGIYTGQNASVNAKHWTIQSNIFQENGGISKFNHGIYIKWAKNWLIQYNVFLRNAAFGIDLNGTCNCIVRYNYSEGNGAGFMELYQDTGGPSNDNRIYYNVSNSERKLMFVGGDSVATAHTGNLVYNNTVYNYIFAGIDIEHGANIAEVRNNIFYSTVSGAHAYAVNPESSILSSSNNLLLAPGTINYNGSYYKGLDEFKKATGLEKDSIAVDPQFVNAGSDFHLTSSSPCKDAGTDVTLTKDFDGNMVPLGSAPDMGVYEYID
jgi:hypothetical protein